MGGDGQSIAIAEALGWPYQTRYIEFCGWQTGPAKYRGRFGSPSLRGVDLAKSDKLEPPWPDLVIAAGRRQVPVELWIKAQNNGRTRLVHILRPLAPSHLFDLIVCDGYPPSERSVAPQFPLMRTAGYPDPPYLARWREHFKNLPRPWVSLLVGGPARPFLMSSETGARMIRDVSSYVAAEGGSLLISTSRRTPPEATAAIEVTRPRNSFFYAWQPNATDNPYLAMLHLADRVIATSDSVSMAVESIRAARPTQIYLLPENKLGLKRFTFQRWLYNDAYKGRESWRTQLAERIRMLGFIEMPDHLKVFQNRLVARGSASYFGKGLAASPVSLPDEIGIIATRIRSWFLDA